MKILHITPTSNGYEEVTLIANSVSRNNSFRVIEKDGQQYYTGGFIIQDTHLVRAILDVIPKEDQYDAMMQLRIEPFVQFYLNKE